MNETPKPIIVKVENENCRIAQIIPWETNPNVFIEIRQYKSYYSPSGWCQPVITIPEVALENVDGLAQFQAAIKVTTKLVAKMSNGSYN